MSSEEESGQVHQTRQSTHAWGTWERISHCSEGSLTLDRSPACLLQDSSQFWQDKTQLLLPWLLGHVLGHREGCDKYRTSTKFCSRFFQTWLGAQQLLSRPQASQTSLRASLQTTTPSFGASGAAAAPLWTSIACSTCHFKSAPSVLGPHYEFIMNICNNYICKGKKVGFLWFSFK